MNVGIMDPIQFGANGRLFEILGEAKEFKKPHLR